MLLMWWKGCKFSEGFRVNNDVSIALIKGFLAIKLGLVVEALSSQRLGRGLGKISVLFAPCLNGRTYLEGKCIMFLFFLTLYQ